MKTTNTLLGIITIILIIFAAVSLGTWYSEYSQKQVEMEIYEMRREWELKANPPLTQNQIDSMNNESDRILDSLSKLYK
jgi:uncharacterized protein YneF (UPF0154 family)